MGSGISIGPAYRLIGALDGLSWVVAVISAQYNHYSAGGVGVEGAAGVAGVLRAVAVAVGVGVGVVVVVVVAVVV